MHGAPLETQTLPATTGLRLLDACSGLPIVDGLCCTLYRRRDRRPLGTAVVTAAGVHHWPELAPRWAASSSSPPQSAELAEVLVADRRERYLPLRLPWPLPGGADHLASVTLASAPQRQAPAGAASVHALLTYRSGLAAAWARVVITDDGGRMTVGMSDGQGRLTVHLPFPRPERRPAASPPDSPPAPPTIAATATLRVFHAPAVGDEAIAALPAGERAAPVPSLTAWAAQPEVRALARVGAADAFGPLRLALDRPSVPVTAGLPPNRSELRLSPL